MEKRTDKHIGSRVTITTPEDDSDIMHEGICRGFSPDFAWVSVQIDGEARVDEWPIERVWFTR